MSGFDKEELEKAQDAVRKWKEEFFKDTGISEVLLVCRVIILSHAGTIPKLTRESCFSLHHLLPPAWLN